jgi:D-hydroxyproline dehydrogenase subunit beta
VHAGSPDVAVIGGGIVGCAAAAFLAERGLRVELFERDELAGAASGRNSGSVQHPFDAVLGELHEETLTHYRELDGFALADEPAGVLMLATERAALAPLAAAVEHDLPQLRPQLLEGEELRALEPLLAPDLAGCRIESGYPVRPAAATLAFAERARRAGAVLHEHAPVRPWVEHGRVAGVCASAEADAGAGQSAPGARGTDACPTERVPAGAVLLAAGPWSSALADPGGAWRPIAALWGVVAELALDRPPRHVLEETGVEQIGTGELEADFSIIAVDGVSGLGSTFSREQPDPAALVAGMRERGSRFAPAVADAPLLGTRACARPLSPDGRPLIGRVPGVEGLWLAAGNGPWGVSTGPATARVAVDALLGAAQPPPALDAARFDAS